tara:strand:+ start:825 stop:1109 length:285 start_codon:yes stop_codon:yes gene_type:complete
MTVWKFKYEITINGETMKYTSIDEFLTHRGTAMGLNRQKLYRLRKGQYSKRFGETTAHALVKKGYDQITIKDINEEIPSIRVRSSDIDLLKSNL